MRRYYKRTFNYCHSELKEPNQPRFFTGKMGNAWVAQYDMGEDLTITFRTRKGKIMDFCDKYHKHCFYYGRKVPFNIKDPKAVHQALLEKRKIKKKTFIEKLKEFFA